MDYLAVISLIIAAVGLVYAAISAYYAKKAFDSTKLISFPKNNSKQCCVEIDNFSKEGRLFEKFIADNQHSKVYLNVRFDSERIEIVDTGIEKWFVIWQEAFEPLQEGEKPSFHKCSGFNVTVVINPSADAGLCWNRGYYDLSGYFSIKGYGGPHQGLMGAVIRPERIS